MTRLTNLLLVRWWRGGGGRLNFAFEHIGLKSLQSSAISSEKNPLDTRNITNNHLVLLFPLFPLFCTIFDIAMGHYLCGRLLPLC